MQVSKSRQIFLVVLSFIGWLAIMLQLYLLLKNRRLEIGDTIIQFFSYFTILTNILLALYSTIILAAPKLQLGTWFFRAATATALTVYITIVGTVYNIVLRFLWAPKGLQKIVDETLHTAIPLLFIFYWFIWIPKQSLKWKDVFPWLIYPLLYFSYVLLRGNLSGLYPYPFMDVAVLGYSKVLWNSLMVSVAFLLVSLVFVAVGKLMSRNRKPEHN